MGSCKYGKLIVILQKNPDGMTQARKLPLYDRFTHTMKRRTMQLELQGQEHSIDANTLVSILVHYQTIVKEANRQLGGGSREVTLKVNALKQGSFIIDVSVVQNVLSQLFSKDAVSYVADLCGAVGGVYALYRKFKGKPIRSEKEKEEAVSINTGDINITINTISIYNQPPVRQAVSKTMEIADEDPSVDGFTVKGEKGDTCALFERKDFKEYIYDDFDTEDNIPDERTVDEDTTLVIVGLNFEPGSRWQFMYNGFKISITVKDDALMQKINEGERFGKGDSIRVKLRRIQRYNKDYRTYENKSYKILEFYEHVIPQKPLGLFGED